MGLSLLVVFLYGSLVWGVFPVKEGISWEGHLWGAVIGFVLAIFYRKYGEQPKKYTWEEEQEDEWDDGEMPYWMQGTEAYRKRIEDHNAQNTSTRPQHITYIYVEKKPSETNDQQEET